MNSKILKNIYFQTCCDELKVFKPGNHSLFSSIPGMSEIKFKYAAKISSEYLTNKKLSLGEAIFYSAKSCKTQLNSNYNLGIIMLCAPILRVCLKDKVNNFKLELKNLLSSISKKDGKLILRAIEFVKPAGINKYEGIGNIFTSNNLSFYEIMSVGSKWDRVSRCYIENYKEIFDFGLPILKLLKNKIAINKAIQILYLNFLGNSTDSHIQRKIGQKRADIVMKMGLQFKKKFKTFKNNENLIKEFDHYLKKFHSNPGTCADLTVTTLLIYKIKDIFKHPL